MRALSFLTLASIAVAALAACATKTTTSPLCPNSCSGHGCCDTTNRQCTCYDGFGSPEDVAEYKYPDCSKKVCPADRAWFAVPGYAASGKEEASVDASANTLSFTALSTESVVASSNSLTFDDSGNTLTFGGGSVPTALAVGRVIQVAGTVLNNFQLTVTADSGSGAATFDSAQAVVDESVTTGTVKITCSPTLKFGGGSSTVPSVFKVGRHVTVRGTTAGSFKSESTILVTGVSGDTVSFAAGDASRVFTESLTSGTVKFTFDPQDAHPVRECSGAGVCNRDTGECECFDEYTGDACQRMACPNDCSGHGECRSLREMAKLERAFPTSLAGSYDDWDADKAYACVCDSSWEVGMGSGQRQQAEWFGPDCSLRRCPTGDDPATIHDEMDGTNSLNVGALAGTGSCIAQSSSPGNLCHVDCSNRGICDHSTGMCACFEGQTGPNCQVPNALAGGG